MHETKHIHWTQRQDIIKRLRRRRWRDRLSQSLGMLSITFILFILFLLLGQVIHRSAGAWQQAYIQVNVNFDPGRLGISNPTDLDQLAVANFAAVIRAGLEQQLGEQTDRGSRRDLSRLVSIGATYRLQKLLTDNPSWFGRSQRLWVLASDDVDLYVQELHAGKEVPKGLLSPQQRAWVNRLIDNKNLERRLNWRFFVAGDSSEPELAGILAALLGSVLSLIVTLAICFPLGVAAAIYLEEYAKQNWLTELIEVNINNLAAVPPVLFGLLGLSIFISVFGMPRSIPLVAGITLALMTLPTIIISTRVAIRSVPDSLREAALGLGASPMQVIWHHILPIAFPGILTGVILGMAQALGEAAPLLMLGMVAFIVDIPVSTTDPATVLPVQIFMWADNPERAFVELTAAAIVVLLLFLVIMNSAAILLRRRLQKRF